MTEAAVLRRVAVGRDGVGAAVADLFERGYACVLMAGVHGEQGYRVVYAFAKPNDRVELQVTVPLDDPTIPSLAALSYPIGRFEREIRDMFGITPTDHPLPFRLVRHAHWPTGWYPMRHGTGEQPRFGADVSAFPFLEVGGDGVYEIPVGPVHAGLIEPGHFRFSVVGETIIRMKARLWYVHRGVEKLFEGRRPQDGMALAERISGDTAAGHSIAFAMACEEALGIDVPERDRWVRACLLELERLYNHVGDIGAIMNDVAFGLANAHAQRVRESLLRLNGSVTGHRLLRGAVGIGWAQEKNLPDVEVVRACASEVAELVELALGHPMVLDRLTATAVLSREDAQRVGVLGYVARASGMDGDARRDHPFVGLPGVAKAGSGSDQAPQPTALEPVVEDGGDVLARFLVRAREVAQSAALVEACVERLREMPVPPGAAHVDEVPAAGMPGRSGLSLVEGWRGRICHWVEVAQDGTLSRVKVVDPSFFTWPALPIALVDTIVPDFPLANKSFNQSYAGNDL